MWLVIFMFVVQLDGPARHTYIKEDCSRSQSPKLGRVGNSQLSSRCCSIEVPNEIVRTTQRKQTTRSIHLRVLIRQAKKWML